ncbi:MAG: AMP-binding protein [Eubacteriales bacterium]|nr:AMP-binding protein [Eubacteriales bacterium]
MKFELKAKRRPDIINNLRDIIRDGADKYGDRPALYYRRNKEELSFSFNDYNNNMNRLGTAFAALGLADAHIAVIGDTCPEYLVTYHATVNGGGVIIPLDRELSDNEIVNFLNISEASAVVYTENFNKRLIHYEEKLPNIRYFIPIMHETEEINNSKIKSYTELIEFGLTQLDSGNLSFIDHDIDMNKLSALLYTSGTTGTSKGVMLSQKNLTDATNAACQSMEYDDESTFVDLLPMHHSYEITCGHMSITALGGTMYINDSLKNTMRSILYFKPNALMVVPLYVETMHKRIWAEIDKKGLHNKVKFGMWLSNLLLKLNIDIRDKLFADVRNALGGNLRSIVCGGAPLSPRLIKDFYCFGIIVLEGYGITECSPLVAVNRPGKERYHSVGQAVYGCEVKIDKKPEDETGEILVRGGNVMMGYYKNEEATKEAFTEDGWFKTGDIGYMDKDDYIYITGRKKNVIILSNGKNIFPEEIEEYLSRSDIIAESIVLGRTRENDDIVITAVIYPDPEKTADMTSEEKKTIIKEEVNAINKTLPVYKQVRDIEIRDAEFSKTTSRKIKRYDL